jgi:hypothetical protein
MSRRAVRRLPPLLLTLSVTWLAACSAPPQKERDQAESAIAAAKAADGAEYAPDDLQKAVASLVEYDRAVAQGDYRSALSQAISARDSAYHAAKVAGERKAAARSNAEGLIVDFQGQVMVGRSRLAGSPPPLPPAAASRTRGIVNRYAKLLQEARSRLEKQDFKGVVALLDPLVQTLRKDLAQPGGRRGK